MRLHKTHFLCIICICIIYSLFLYPIIQIYKTMSYNVKGRFRRKINNPTRIGNLDRDANRLSFFRKLTDRVNYKVWNRNKFNYQTHATDASLQISRDRKLKASIDRKKRTMRHAAQVITMQPNTSEFTIIKVQPKTQTFVKATLYSPAGPVTIYVYSQFEDRYISESIINGGKWEDNVGRQLQKIIKKNPAVTFLDLGANVGVFTLQVALMGIPVIAVDCLYSNVERLASAVAFNNLTNSVTIVYNAVSNVRGKTLLGREPKNIGGTYVKYGDTPNLSIGEEDIPIQSILLNDLIEKVETMSVVVKMDVERSEDRVLAGGQQFFDAFKIQYVIMEWFQHEKKKSGGYIKNFMRIRDFKPYTLGYGHEVPLSDSATWPDIIVWAKL